MMNLYLIYNSDLQEYSTPFCFKTNRQALVSFDKMVEDYKKNPRLSDVVVELFNIGTFDIDTGKIIYIDKSSWIKVSSNSEVIENE